MPMGLRVEVPAGYEQWGYGGADVGGIRGVGTRGVLGVQILVGLGGAGGFRGAGAGGMLGVQMPVGLGMQVPAGCSGCRFG